MLPTLTCIINIINIIKSVHKSLRQTTSIRHFIERTQVAAGKVNKLVNQENTTYVKIYLQTAKPVNRKRRQWIKHNKRLV